MNTSRPKPPQRRERPYVWVALLGLLVLGSVPLLYKLQGDGVVDRREVMAIAASDETWRRQAMLAEDGMTLERMVPMRSGEPVLDEPPGLAWLQVLAFLPLDSSEASVSQLVYRARLVSVGFALLALGAVFWAGMSVGGLRTGVCAGLVFVANPLLVLYGRMATADAPTVGLGMLAVAAALWGMRPLKPAPSLRRQGMGWLICGSALGLMALTSGPVVVPVVVLPLGIMVLLCDRRISHTFGLIAAAALAFLLITPWAIHVHRQDPEAWVGWTRLVRPTLDLHQFASVAGTRSIGLLVGSGVWVLLAIAAFVMPWGQLDKPTRRRMFIGWSWAVSAIVVVMFAPSSLNPTTGGLVTGVLLAIPVVALLTGQMLRRVHDMASEGRDSVAWRIARWPTAGLVIGLSIAGPAALYWQPQIQTMHLLTWILTGSLLLIVSILGAKWAARPRPDHAIATWAVWSVLAMTLVMIPYSQRTQQRVGASPLHRITAGLPTSEPAPAHLAAEQDPTLWTRHSATVPPYPRQDRITHRTRTLEN